MKKTIHLPIPAFTALKKLGQDINDARRRRRITVKLLAERASLSQSTILKIERGDPTVSMGGYASVIFVLGMIDRLRVLADSASDSIGRRIQDEKLPQRVRLPRNKERIL